MSCAEGYCEYSGTRGVVAGAIDKPVSRVAVQQRALAAAIRLALGVNASGVSDTLILTIDSGVNSKALGQLGWVEIV